MKSDRAAIRNVKKLQEIWDKTEKPDFRLRRDINDARAYLETVKVRQKAKRREKAAERKEAQLVEAKEEAVRALEAATKAKRAARKAKKTAKASRHGTYISILII